MIQLVVFDIAGTTVDEQNIVYKTVCEAVRQAGYPVPYDLVLLHAAGKEKFEAIRSVVEAFTGQSPEVAHIRDIHQGFEPALEEAYRILQPAPMPGAEEVFQELRARGIKMALNTGYKRIIAHILLQKLGWTEGRTFDALITADDVLLSRPDPAMIFAAMERLEILEPHLVAKIGDTIIDIQEGQHAGCSICAGITTGAQTEEQLRSAEPTHIFHHLSELLTAL